MSRNTEPDAVQISMDKYTRLVDAESRITILMQMFSKAESFDAFDFETIKVFLMEHRQKGEQQ